MDLDRYREQTGRRRFQFGLLILGLIVLAAFSLFVGRYPAPFLTPPSLLTSDPLAERLVFGLRLPRILAALMMGLSLGAGGTVLQMVFRNPLVEPGTLGVSQGAAFGAALTILAGATSPLTIELTAVLFAILGLTLSYFLATRMRYGGWVLRLILSGIAISALFSAGVGLMKYLADPLTELPEITFWLLGGLFNVTWRELFFLFPPVLIGSILVLALRWRLNLLTLSDETAFSLGTQLGRERVVMVFGAIIGVAAVTAVGGIIAWVGLIVPHLSRRIFGADAQFTLPAAMLIGAYYVLICDNVARSLLPGEIPLGILTAFFGALIFAGLMTRAPLRRRP